MSRATHNLWRGIKGGSRLRIGIGLALGTLAVLRRAIRPEPVLVERHVLRPGESLVVETSGVVPAEERRKRRERRRRSRLLRQAIDALEESEGSPELEERVGPD